jgi:COMPASS component SWD3
LEIAAHGDPITSVSFSDDSSMVLTGSYDGLIRLWDAENGRCLKTLVDNDNPAVAWAVFTPNSRYILVATLDSCLRLWCPTTARCVRTFTAPGFTLRKFSCAAKISVRSDKVVLFAGSEDGFIYYWNLATKELLGCTQVFADSPVLSLDIFESTLCCTGIEQNSSKLYLFLILQ